MRETMSRLALVALLALPGTACRAEPTRVTPAGFDRALANARPGETLVLDRATFPRLTIVDRRFDRPITIDARAATVHGVTLRGSAGISWQGGTITTDASETFAVAIDYSQNIEIRDVKASGARVGVSISRSRDVRVLNNDFDGLRSDGVNVAMTQSVRIEGNVCHNFRPIPPVYDPRGKLIEDGDHPDCIQGWSSPGYPPTADVTIIGNRGEGFMQGVFFGNPGQGGYDRLVIRDNQFTLSAWNGVVVVEARDSVVRDNIVRTVPGAKALNYPFQPVTSWVKVDGVRNRLCGNKVDQPRFSDGTGRCE